MDFLRLALESIRGVASHPLAFVAYVLVVVSWLVVMLKVKRSKQLLKHLQKLPAADRLKALQLEMGAVELASGLTPQDWLKSRVHLYYFVGFATLCLCGVVVFAVAYTRPSPPEGAKSPSVDIGLYDGQGASPGNTSHEASRSDPKPQPRQTVARPKRPSPKRAPLRTTQGATDRPARMVNEVAKGSASDATIAYAATHRAGALDISYTSPYLERIRQDGQVEGLSATKLFQWQFPQISIKVVNNTHVTSLLTKAFITVKHSEVNREPIPVVHDRSFQKLTISNEGWGPIRDPRLTMGIDEELRCMTANETPVTGQHQIELPSIETSADVTILPYMPARLRTARAVCAYGELQYSTDRLQRRRLPFKTRIHLEPDFAAPVPPSFIYNVQLDADRAAHVVPVEIAQEILAKRADHFVFILGANKSAHFDLNISFRDAAGNTVRGGDLTVDIFVPRSQAGQLEGRALVRQK